MLAADPNPNPLVRGQFRDNQTTYTVRASSAAAPDSFQVYANGIAADIVLIVSGLNSGHLHATWGAEWRPYALDWKAWLEDSAFRVFYSGSVATGRGGPEAPGTVRFCRG